MAGIANVLRNFARSPQGRRLTEQAKRAASDPRNRAKVEQLRARFLKKR